MRSVLKVALSVLLLAHSAYAQQRTIVGSQEIVPARVGDVPFSVKGVLGQTANLQNWKDSTNVEVASLSAVGVLSISGISLSSAEPRVKLTETDQGANGKVWDLDVNGGVFSLRTRTDADAAGTTAFSVTRSGTGLTAFAITGPLTVSAGETLTTAASLLNFYGATTADGAWKGGTSGGLGILQARAGDDSTFVDVLVLDAAYGAGWDGSNTVPTKNAVYDKIEIVTAGETAALVSNIAYNATTWDGVTTIAPSKNAVRDEIEARMPGVAAHTIPLAKITLGGTNGSITVNAFGIVTAYVDPT